jgi:malate dehydrogenase (oxaloacetate-decarboxylating)
LNFFSIKIDPLTGEEYYEVNLRGRLILNNPLLNKGSCFTEEERMSLELDGLLRAGVSTLEQEVERTLEQYRRKPDDLERYIFLQGVLDRDETLFYRLLYENLEEMVPIVYTPTVGQACLMLSHIMRRYRGLYVTPQDIGNIDKILESGSRAAVYLIVVTDGERILGLGDLGSDGMGIPIGKVNLYVGAGGLHPAGCLPVTLDVGTNNPRLLDDPVYQGYRHRRLEGQEYDEFIERFVLGVKRVFPHALLQWEDFAKHKAFLLMQRYRERILSFNDDIQGTGSTALAALMTAMRIKKSRLMDQRFVIVGLGQAGSGIAFHIRAQLRDDGLTDAEIRQRIFALDAPGLVMDDWPGLEPQMRLFAQPRAAIDGWKLRSPEAVGLEDVVRNTGATVLIGVTAQPKLFDANILGLMAANDSRPVIMALSNPTSKSECSPEDVFRATGGRGLLATGSPFPPMVTPGSDFRVSQANNMFIFPGVGLGALVSQASKVTDRMFLAASRALSRMVSPDMETRGQLLPEAGVIREVAFQVALAVAKEARDSGLGRMVSDDRFENLIRRAQWLPRYYPYRPGPIGG